MKYSLEKVLAAIKDSSGIVSLVAKRLGCEWHTAKKYINNWEQTKQAIDDENEAILDLAESKTYEAINNGDMSAARFILMTKGKHRGYTERQEISGKDGGEIIIKEVIVNRETINTDKE